LNDESVRQNLDEKLAEYAFFPLTHIFNESQRLSSRCLELAVLSLQILALQGWREKLSSEMGKQLLILLTLLAGGSPSQTQSEPPSDDLKVAAFSCIGTLVTLLGASKQSKSIFQDVLGSRNIVDQLVYLLLGAISDDVSDKVQLAASDAVLQVEEQIGNRLVLASLLPRTVSTLTKVLRPSTQHRRTYKVLEANLILLRFTLQRVLNDQVALASPDTQESEVILRDEGGIPQALDSSWLKATSAQVKIALINVAKLRRHERTEVKRALARLCVMVLEECSKSLAECASVMLETLLSLSTDAGMDDITSDLKFLLTSKPSLVDDLKENLQRWMVSLPRLMRANDDRPRLAALAQISGGFQLLSSLGSTSGITQQSLPTTLIDSVVGAMQPQDQKLIASISEPASSISQLLTTKNGNVQNHFRTIVLGQQAQQGSLVELQSMLATLGALDQALSIARTIIDTVASAEGEQKLAAMWLALKLLACISHDAISNFVTVSDTYSELSIQKPFLVSDLYSFTLPLLVEDDHDEPLTDARLQLQALALECLVLQAEQLGMSYRPELMESLYPVLSLLGSQNGSLQQHAVTALDLLARACQYSSVTDMLVDNADYLVNSIALKLNSSNLAPQAPQVLLMMVRLCGARLIPYLDDLIGGIFMALDDFHGYPNLVEMLFEVLSGIVDEGVKQPRLAITEGKEAPEHRKTDQKPSELGDILGDLLARKNRKQRLVDEDDEQFTTAPQRPWSDRLDGPQPEKSIPGAEALMEDEENEAMPIANTSDEIEKPLSKSHQLLLSIGQATTPHLSSPSPTVRHTLLNLLDRIAPLLAKDENSFLPLINSIWPSLAARIFSEVGADGAGEAAFNVCAAAHTIASLCEGAGDFMASRIEDIFPQLQSLWKSTLKRVEDNRTRTVKRISAAQNGTDLIGSTDLQLVKAHPTDLQTSTAPAHPLAMNRTTDAKILDALVNLFSSILNYVRITDENGDAILSMLSPIINESKSETARQALETWNADALWLVCQRMKIELQMIEGLRDSSDWEWKSISTPFDVNSALSFVLRRVVF
jgi:hypothetical protein